MVMHRYLLQFRQRRYLILLGALVALLVVEPIAASLGMMEATFDALLVVVLGVLALAVAQDKGWWLIALVLCVPAAVLSVGGHVVAATNQHVGLSIGHGIAAVFFVVVAGKIVASIIRSEDISTDSVFGAICGYLLLGVAWGLTYTVLQSVDSHAFQMSDALRQHMEDNKDARNVFNYYSFVTLSTVGYGDVTPRSEVARTLSWVEAVTGQLYLAVLIAGLMSALVTLRISPDRRGSTRSAD
jgi:hypothetical protein